MPWSNGQATAVPVGARSGSHREGDLTAAALHERYLAEVFHYVLRRVPRVDEAEDITAEVFAAAAAGLSRYRGQVSPSLWLLGIARRQIAAALRRRGARRETLKSELCAQTADAEALWEAMLVTEAPDVALVREEAKKVLQELVSSLSPDQREALMLQYVERRSVAEIAIVMGRSPASAKSLLQRARATIYRRGRAYFLEDERGER